MRGLRSRPAAAIATVFVISCVAGCHRERVQGETIEESEVRIASVVHTADPATATQLLRGFHDVEQNAWRWTRGAFSVALRPPSGAAQKGATLTLRFSVPQQVLERLSSVAVSAVVEGTALPAQSYKQAGTHVYRQDVPSSALAASIARVDFSLDKSLPPGTLDQRELGIVVSSIGLEAK
jgi:hypothetical protein